MRKVRKQVRDAARELGFKVCRVTGYLRRNPGSPSNSQWYEVILGCPCGRTKLLHVSEQSLPYLAAELADHLRKDKLL